MDRFLIGFHVSTHSRLKAAGKAEDVEAVNYYSFNTQPPEGGWLNVAWLCLTVGCFNTQPPEGGWTYFTLSLFYLFRFNTQPPEGGWI